MTDQVINRLQERFGSSRRKTGIKYQANAAQVDNPGVAYG
jgi:hypothetical protein